MDNVIINGYVNKLIRNVDGKFDKFGRSWFRVSAKWLEKTVLDLGYPSMEVFLDTYTYDQSDEIIDFALEDGAVLACGAGITITEEMTVSEWCPNCCAEVELPAIFKAHKCPNCQEKIIPCAQCETQNCGSCPID